MTERKLRQLKKSLEHAQEQYIEAKYAVVVFKAKYDSATELLQEAESAYSQEHKYDHL